MKNLTNVIIVILSFFAFSGCLKDESNIDIKKMNTISILDIEEDYDNPLNWVLGTRIQLNPALKFAQEEHHDLSYVWTIAFDTVSTEKNLDIFLNAKTGKKVSCAFSVKDNKTGISYIQKFFTNISTPYSKGWMFLCENKEGKGQFNFLDDKGNYYPELYRSINKESLSSDPQCLRLHFWSPQDPTRSNYVNIVCKGGPNQSVELNCVDMQKEAYNNQEFIDKCPPVNFAPTYIDYCSSGHMIISNGKCYSRVGNYLSFITGRFDNIPLDVRPTSSLGTNEYPLKNDYELIDWSCDIRCLDFFNEVIFFDKKNSAYMLCNAKELYPFPSQEHDEIKAFNPNNINGELIAGTKTHLLSYSPITGDSFALIKRTDSYYIQKYCYDIYAFYFGKTSFHALEDKVFPGSDDLDEESIVLFAKRTRGHYMYYTTKENKIRIYNYKSGTLRDMELGHSAPGKITELALSEDEETLVIGYDNNGVGDIYFVSTNFVDEGENMREPILGKMGKPVDILQKVDYRNMYY